MAESKSLEDRMTFPSESKDQPSTSTAPKSTRTQQPDDPKDGGVEGAQTDGAPADQNGSTLREPEFDVEVKLSDIQADPNNPLYSAKTFEELNLSVLRP